MKAIITGRNGFVGQYLKRQLESNGVKTYAYDMHNSKDIRNYEQLRNYIDKIRPDQIYHLAAQAYVPESFINPIRTFEVNLIGSLNLLEAIRQLGLKTQILLAGTSEEYGDSEVSEESLPSPLSPYAISKLSMDYLGQLYAKSYGMHIVITRAFNHTGAGRGEMYAESAWAKQIAEIENGQRQVLEHGNLQTMRNYTDVRDMVRAYELAINLPSDVYNICSEQNISMQEVLDMLCSFSDIAINTRINPSLYRPSDFSFNIPNCDKFQRLSSWQPDYELSDTLRGILEYWRGK